MKHFVGLMQSKHPTKQFTMSLQELFNVRIMFLTSFLLVGQFLVYCDNTLACGLILQSLQLPSCLALKKRPLQVIDFCISLGLKEDPFPGCLKCQPIIFLSSSPCLSMRSTQCIYRVNQTELMLMQ